MFPKFFSSAISKKHSKCPEEQFVKISHSKKLLQKWKVFRTFFRRSRRFVGNFLADSSKLHSTCRVTFCGETMFRSKMFFGNFFRNWSDKLSTFQRNCSRKVVQTDFYASIEEIVVPKCWGENFVFEKQLYFSRILKFAAKLYQFIINEFKAGSTNLPFKCQKSFLGATSIWKKVVFLVSDYSELEHRVVSVSQKQFVSFLKKVFYVCRGTVCEKLSFKKKTLRNEIFQDIYWKVSVFCWNNSGNLVKTAFYLSIVTFDQKQYSRVK